MYWIRVKIAIVSRYYPPASGAAASRIFSYSKELSERGYEVTVFTGVPGEDRLGNIKIERLDCFLESKSLFSNIACQTVFLVRAFLSVLFFEQDLLVVESSFPGMGFLGLAMKKLFGKKYVLVIADTQIEYLEEEKKIGKRTASFLKKARNFFIRESEKTVTVTNAFKKILTEAGAEAEKIRVVYNGSDTESFYPENKKSKTWHKKPEEAVIIYAGAMGLIHDPDTIVETAKLLKGKARFLLVGKGFKKARLSKKIKGMNIENTLLLDQINHEKLRKIFWKADIGIDVLKERKSEKAILAVKVLDYMASGLPVIFAGKGETAELVKEAGAGIVVAEKTPIKISKAILKMLSDRKQMERLGRNSAEHVMKNFSKSEKAKEFAEIVEAVLEKKVVS